MSRDYNYSQVRSVCVHFQDRGFASVGLLKGGFVGTTANLAGWSTRACDANHLCAMGIEASLVPLVQALYVKVACVASTVTWRHQWVLWGVVRLITHIANVSFAHRHTGKSQRARGWTIVVVAVVIVIAVAPLASPIGSSLCRAFARQRGASETVIARSRPRSVPLLRTSITGRVSSITSFGFAAESARNVHRAFFHREGSKVIIGVKGKGLVFQKLNNATV